MPSAESASEAARRPGGAVSPPGRSRWLAIVLGLVHPLIAADPVTVSGRAMGTHWAAKIVPAAVAVAPADVERVVAARLEELERIFSIYRPHSEVMRFNASAGGAWVAVSPELAEVAEASGHISELTAGAFDLTVHPLVLLWGFGPVRRSGTLPTEAEIAQARSRVDWRVVEVRREPPALRKPAGGCALDPSSMAKGYAADAISALLRARGWDNHLVQIAGDLCARGAGPRGDGWPVAVESPFPGAREPAAVVRLVDQALSTSGSYRNFFVAGGRRYGHILDPRTGRPAEHSLVAVSVIHASGARSSALATALFVLGPEAGLRLAREQGLAALLQVDEGGQGVSRPTPGFAAAAR